MQPAGQFRMIAKTLHALESVLAKEIEELGASDIEIGKRMVSFSGDKAMLYKANLRLRTALRILKPIYTFKAKNPDELYEAMVNLDWEQVMSGTQTFAVDTTVYSEDFTHSKFVGYRTKDAIVDYFRSKNGTRPSVRLDNPDIYLNVHIAQNEVTLSLDSSGESLHKRGYRAVQTDAPINEVLAAGILLMAGWQGETDLIDPMCGSGTFLIEAALIARNIAPGIYRSGFAFERWRDYDQALFEEIYHDDSQERDFTHHIYGSDILPNAIQIAQRNTARAGLNKYIDLQVKSMQERPQPRKPALIVMNPPYGERLRLSNPESLYAMIGERLKHNFPGCTAWVIAYRPEHFDSIGLRHSSRIELMNGSLDCELRSYELFSGKRDDYKSRQRTEQPERDRRPKLQGNKRDKHQRSRQNREQHYKPFSKHTEGKHRRNRRDAQGYQQEGERRERPQYDAQRQLNKPKFEREGGRAPRPQKKGLWPGDRFRATDSDGFGARRRPKKPLSFQVLKDED